MFLFPTKLTWDTIKPQRLIISRTWLTFTLILTSEILVLYTSFLQYLYKYITGILRIVYCVITGYMLEYMHTLGRLY